MTELLEYFVKVFQIYAHAKFFSCFLKSKECHTILGTKVLTDTNQSLPALYGLYVFLIDLNRKGVHNQSYRKMGFFCLKPSMRGVVP